MPLNSDGRTGWFYRYFTGNNNNTMKEISDNKIIEAWTTADDKQKEMLRQLYGNELQSIVEMSSIKTVDDAIKYIGAGNIPPKELALIKAKNVPVQLRAFAKLMVVCAAINKACPNNGKSMYCIVIHAANNYNRYLSALGGGHCYRRLDLSPASLCDMHVRGLIMNNLSCAEYCMKQFERIWWEYYMGRPEKKEEDDKE